MNDIIKTITPSSEMVTNFSNDNVSLQMKIKSLEEEIWSLKNENSTLKGDIKTQLKVIENLSRFENRHCEDSIANKDKVNVNCEFNNLKNESQWQIATSRNKDGHSTNAGKVTLERTRKSNDIHFKLSHRFSPLHVNQYLTRETSTIPNIPEKIPTNCRNTFLHTTNTVRNKRPLVYTTKNYLKVLVVGDSHIKWIRRNDCNKELKNGKAIFWSFSGANTKQLDH